MANFDYDIIRNHYATEAALIAGIASRRWAYAIDTRRLVINDAATFRYFWDSTRLADTGGTYGDALIGCAGITGVTPSGGSSGGVASLHNMLIGIAGTGNANFIQNGTSQQASSNFNISGAGVIGTTLRVASTTRHDGAVAIGGAASASIALFIDNLVTTGVDQSGILVQSVASSAAVNTLTGIGVVLATESASFTIADVYGIQIMGLALGSGASATNHYGLKIENIASAGTNYSIHTGAGLVRLGGNLITAAGRQVVTHTFSSPQTLSSVHHFVLVSGTTTLTLPAAASHPGRVYFIKNTGSDTVTIARSGSDTIDGATSATLVDIGDAAGGYAASGFISDGSNWFSFPMQYIPPA